MALADKVKAMDMLSLKVYGKHLLYLQKTQLKIVVNTIHNITEIMEGLNSEE